MIGSSLFFPFLSTQGSLRLTLFLVFSLYLAKQTDSVEPFLAQICCAYVLRLVVAILALSSCLLGFGIREHPPRSI